MTELFETREKFYALIIIQTKRIKAGQIKNHQLVKTLISIVENIGKVWVKADRMGLKKHFDKYKRI